MKNISKEAMEIITAIQRYIDKNRNAEVIDHYYQTHGTYKGIVEYLSNIDNGEKNEQMHST